MSLHVIGTMAAISRENHSCHNSSVRWVTGDTKLIHRSHFSMLGSQTRTKQSCRPLVVDRCVTIHFVS